MRYFKRSHGHSGEFHYLCHDCLNEIHMNYTMNLDLKLDGESRHIFRDEIFNAFREVEPSVKVICNKCGSEMIRYNDVMIDVAADFIKNGFTVVRTINSSVHDHTYIGGTTKFLYTITYENGRGEITDNNEINYPGIVIEANPKQLEVITEVLERISGNYPGISIGMTDDKNIVAIFSTDTQYMRKKQFGYFEEYCRYILCGAAYRLGERIDKFRKLR